MNRTRLTFRDRALVGGVLLVAASFLSTPAIANGGDFFEEFAAHFLQTNTNVGPSYFGFVRDERGRVIPNASVSATIISSGSGMVVQSDILGHYKIPGFAKTIDPESVAIACSKQGYSQVSSDRRIQQRDPNTPIETSCVLGSETASSS